jgi:diguanylate cyclase
MTTSASFPLATSDKAGRAEPTVAVERNFGVVSWAFIAIGFLLAGLHAGLGSPADRSLVYAATGIGLLLACALSERFLRPEQRIWAPLLVLVTLQGAGHFPKSPGWDAGENVLLFEYTTLAAQITLFVVLFFVVRDRAPAHLRAVLSEWPTLLLGTVLVAWVSFARDILGDTGSELSTIIVRGLEQPVFVLVLFLLVTLVLADAARQRSVLLLEFAVAALLGTQLLHGLTVNTDADVDLRFINAPLVLSMFLVAGAVTHPSIRHLLERNPRQRSRPLLARLALITTALVFPVILLASSSPVGSTDQLIRITLASLLAISVMVRVIRSTAASERAQAELVRTARTDPLTQLPNRDLVVELLEQALREATYTNLCVGVLFIDVDRFKNVNDSLGHGVGDEVLRSISTRLTAALPPRCVIGRISGDEFVVVDPGALAGDEAVALATTALASFGEAMSIAKGDVFVTASIGVAFSTPDRPFSAADLLRQADTAMYRAKDAGRGRVEVFDSSMLERVTQRLGLENALYRALERNEMRLHHQPIVDLELGAVTGFESLMRWDRAGLVVSPAEFIPIAEDTGFIVPLGAWALVEALSDLRHFIDQGLVSEYTTVSVNVSPRQLHDPRFQIVVDEALRRSRLDPEHLWLEVTESIMITEPTKLRSTLEQIRGLGVRIAIDDFGTGYSSLSMLQDFPIQRVKIDRAFVKDIGTDPNAVSLVRTIVAMAAALDLDLVAEGVETVEQLQILRELGCDKVQGYLVSRPIPTQQMATAIGVIEREVRWAPA